MAPKTGQEATAAEGAKISLAGVPVLINRRMPVGWIILVHGDDTFTLFQPEENSMALNRILTVHEVTKNREGLTRAILQDDDFGTVGTGLRFETDTITILTDDDDLAPGDQLEMTVSKLP